MRCVVVAIAVVATIAAASAEDHGPSRPNIVVILADDLGYSDLASYGSEVETPNLDHLAREGIRFTHFYNFSRCMPTRAALLTGHYPHVAGLGGAVRYAGDDDGAAGVSRRFLGDEPGPYQGYLYTSIPTIAELLRDAGYKTYMTGKWHVGEHEEHWPRARGFNEFFGLIGGESSYFEATTGKGHPAQMVVNDEPWEPASTGYYATDAYSDSAAGYITEHTAMYPDRPFFLYLAYTAPHFPLHAKPGDIRKYRGVYDVGWDRVRANRIENQRRLGLADERHDYSKRPDSVPAWEDIQDKGAWSRRMEVFAAMIDSMDQGIGRVIGALEKTGQLDNTLVLFLSDNGPSSRALDNRPAYDPSAEVGEKDSYYNIREPWAWVSATPFRGYKAQALEGGVRSPLIAYWPNGIVETGRLVDSPLMVTDILPTILKLTGKPYSASFGSVPVPELPGTDFSRLFDGSGTVAPRTFYFEHYGHRAVMASGWKAVYSPVVGTWSLFDLTEDPAETVNRAAGHPNRLSALIDTWMEWAETTGVRLQD